MDGALEVWILGRFLLLSESWKSIQELSHIQQVQHQLSFVPGKQKAVTPIPAHASFICQLVHIIYSY